MMSALTKGTSEVKPYTKAQRATQRRNWRSLEGCACVQNGAKKLNEMCTREMVRCNERLATINRNNERDGVPVFLPDGTRHP